MDCGKLLNKLMFCLALQQICADSVLFFCVLSANWHRILQSIIGNLRLHYLWIGQQSPPLFCVSSLLLAPEPIFNLQGVELSGLILARASPGELTGMKGHGQKGRHCALATTALKTFFFFLRGNKRRGKGKVSEYSSERDWGVQMRIFVTEAPFCKRLFRHHCCELILLREKSHCYLELCVCAFDPHIFCLNFLFPSRLIRRIHKGTIQCRDLKFFSKNNLKGNKHRKKWQSSFEKGN